VGDGVGDVVGDGVGDTVGDVVGDVVALMHAGPLLGVETMLSNASYTKQCMFKYKLNPKQSTRWLHSAAHCGTVVCGCVVDLTWPYGSCKSQALDQYPS
jgi:hypothetical protein